MAAKTILIFVGLFAIVAADDAEYGNLTENVNEQVKVVAIPSNFEPIHMPDVQTEEQPPVASIVKVHIEECKKELYEMNEQVKVDMANDKCEEWGLLVCFLQKMEVMNGGRINIEKLEELVTPFLPGESSERFLTSSVQQCQAQSEVSDKPCEVMDNYYKCLIAKLRNDQKSMSNEIEDIKIRPEIEMI